MSYYHHRNEEKEAARQKNLGLIRQLADKRDNLCGIGTRKVKYFLNRKIKSGDILAKAYRLILEIEDKNITAKKTGEKYGYYGYEYTEKIYQEKEKLIRELIQFCKDNEFKYGYEDSDNYSAKMIIYFDLPNMEQVSFHCNFTRKDKEGLVKYDGEWDGLVNSSLDKIERTLYNMYGEELKAIADNNNKSMEIK